MPSDSSASGQRKACTSCRALKTRCLPSSGPEAPCLRCVGLGHECVYSALKRGPPKGRKRVPRLDRPRSIQPSAATCTSEGVLPTGRAAVDDSPPPSFAQVLSAAYSPVASTSTLRPTTQPPIASFFPNELAAAPLRVTLESYFEPDAALDPTPPAAASWLVYTDPVAVGLISEPEAQYLFREFMERVAPFGHIFDPLYHTYERVRASPTLFAAVIAASARFFHPSLAEITLDLAETNIGRALRRDDIGIPLVQALMVLVYWKSIADRSAYHKIGLAIRLLAQLRISWDTDREFTSIEAERAQVDAERTMSMMPATEFSYSILLRLPSHSISVPGHSEMMRWAQRHAHLGVPGDMFKAFLAELWSFHFSERGDLWFRSAAEWEERQAAWGAVVNKWLQSGHIPREYRGNAEMLAQAGTISRAFLGLKLGFGTASAVLDIAEPFADRLKEMLRLGELLFYPEYALSGVMLPAVLVYHVSCQLFLRRLNFR
ncbi:uncharacterized protein COLE_06416 [Cutaneotrichosporon oleaginosum]|uniref:uncharacterized protein n=1 Tax=Cutaneotrichosporon oleaginosum TaxID=879819 RepID=UPI001324EA7A|nr:hypothetical protein COLE_06416 [Cutaneotrichosporon oleaginosum]